MENAALRLSRQALPEVQVELVVRNEVFALPGLASTGRRKCLAA